MEQYTITEQICQRCDSRDTLEFTEQHESEDADTGEYSMYSGFKCTICGCFHEENSAFIEYHIERELHTTYNVKSWLN